MNSPKRIFITGISSPLVQALVPELLAQGHHITGLSRQEIILAGVTMVQGGLDKSSAWKEPLQQCNMIIHGAAITHSHELDKYLEVNYEGTKNLIDNCLPDTGFVFISSRTAGPESGGYGRSKWLAEKYLKEKLNRYLILSPSEVYGGSKQEGVEKLIQDAMSKKFIPYPAGVDSKLSPIHIEDLKHHILSLICAEHWPKNAQILNGSAELTYAELIRVVAQTAKNGVKLIPIPIWIMRLLARLSGILPGVLPFTADQVARLYAPKPFQLPEITSRISLEEYVLTLLDGSKPF